MIFSILSKDISISKFNAIITLFIFTTSFNTQAYSPKADWLKTLPSLGDIELVTTPEQDHLALFKAFDEAQKSIMIGIFGISSAEMGNQIEKQVKRGIDVSIICDKYCTSNPKRQAIFDQLKKAGAHMVTASTGFSISHWKMFVIDEKKAFISTMNFITRTEQMRDIGIFTENKDVVSEIVSVFKQDFENSKTNQNTTPPLKNKNLIWSPNNSEEKLIDLIKSADKTIDIWIENMGHANIHTALQQATKRQVRVRVLTSLCGMGMSGEAAFKNLTDLKSKGVIVKGSGYPATTEMPYIHAKTLHVDGSIIFLGSENFSLNSLTKARELGVVLQNASVENRLQTLFENDWSQALDIPETSDEKCTPLTTNGVD